MRGLFTGSVVKAVNPEKVGLVVPVANWSKCTVIVSIQNLVFGLTSQISPAQGSPDAHSLQHIFPSEKQLPNGAPLVVKADVRVQLPSILIDIT